MVTVVGTVVGGGGGVGGGGVGGGVGGGATVVRAVFVFFVEAALLVLAVGAEVLGVVVVAPDAPVCRAAEEVAAGAEPFERPTKKATATPAAAAATRSSAARRTGSGTGGRPRSLRGERGMTRVGSPPATIVDASLSVTA